LSPYFGGQEQKKQKKKIADYGDEMGCGYSVGNERELIKEMRTTDEKVYQRLNTFGEQLGQERACEGKGKEYITAGHDQSYQR